MKNVYDFNDLKKTLFGGFSKEVHHVELMVDHDIKEAFLGKPITSTIEETEFWYNAGYEYIPIVISAFGFIDGENHGEIMVEKEFKYSKYKINSQKKYWAREGVGIITNFKQFYDYPWPDPELIDLNIFKEIEKIKKKEIGIIGIIPRLFVAVWMLMGYEFFSYALNDEPKLVQAVFSKVGDIQLLIFQRLAKEINVGAMWLGDDIAYREGLMADPSVFRSLLFPWYREMGAICKKNKIPFIYHSDGNLLQVMDNLIDCGINALHPIEPNAMDAVFLKREYKEKICLIGNIELDTLSRGSEEQVKELTSSRLEKLWEFGGYCPGSSNSVTNYVPLKNYLAMLDTIQDFRKTIDNKS